MSFFLAIAFDPSTRLEIRRALGQVQPLFPKARWEPLEKAHLTLVFLAHQRPDAARVAETAQKHCRFSLQLSGFGAFDSKVLWLGVEGELEPLRALQADLSQHLDAPDRAREFTPHVTLARGRGLSAQGDFRSPLFEVSDIHLFESRSGTYRVLESFPLGAG